MKMLSFFMMILLASTCADSGKETEQAVNTNPIEVPSQNGMQRAYFASGCFWCVEEIYEGVKGVNESISGYSGGHTENPTYEDSNTGRTGHAEANEIIYDPEVVSFKTLVDVYFASQNIEQANGQGPDNGSQYSDKTLKAKIPEREIALMINLGRCSSGNFFLVTSL